MPKMVEENISKDDAIKFFRKFVSENEGISEEDAGMRINKDVEIGLGISTHIAEIKNIINELENTNPNYALKILVTTINVLLNRYPLKLKKELLCVIADSLGSTENAVKRFDMKIEEYKNKEKQEV